LSNDVCVFAKKPNVTARFFASTVRQLYSRRIWRAVLSLFVSEPPRRDRFRIVRKQVCSAFYRESSERFKRTKHQIDPGVGEPLVGRLLYFDALK